MSTATCEVLRDKANRALSGSLILKGRKDAISESVRKDREFLTDGEKKYGEVQSRLDTLTYALQVMKDIMDEISRSRIENVVKLITYGLKVIFHDKDYALDIVIDDKRNNKAAELFLIEMLPNGEAQRSRLRDSVGGGVQAIIGFLLQIYYLKNFGLSPILFCDEAFSQISDDYIDNLRTLIDRLAIKDQFILVLISHDSRLIPLADRIYEVKNGVVTKIERGKATEVATNDTGSQQ